MTADKMFDPDDPDGGTLIKSFRCSDFRHVNNPADDPVCGILMKPS
jgi:hypothetical protein